MHACARPYIRAYPRASLLRPFVTAEQVFSSFSKSSTPYEFAILAPRSTAPRDYRYCPPCHCHCHCHCHCRCRCHCRSFVSPPHRRTHDRVAISRSRDTSFPRLYAPRDSPLRCFTCFARSDVVTVTGLGRSSIFVVASCRDLSRVAAPRDETAVRIRRRISRGTIFSTICFYQFFFPPPYIYSPERALWAPRAV